MAFQALPDRSSFAFAADVKRGTSGTGGRI
jgi:hypothetical protein